jgi:hypothetical protein
MAHAALGKPDRELPDDRPRPADRMGLVAARDLQPGDVVDRGAFGSRSLRWASPVEAWDEGPAGGCETVWAAMSPCWRAPAAP